MELPGRQGIVHNGEQVGNVDDHLDVDNDIVKGGGDDLQGGDRVGDGPQL